MPSWLEAIVGTNPITHLATAVRGLMEGDPNGRATSGSCSAEAAALTVGLRPAHHPPVPQPQAEYASYAQGP